MGAVKRGPQLGHLDRGELVVQPAIRLWPVFRVYRGYEEPEAPVVGGSAWEARSEGTGGMEMGKMRWLVIVAFALVLAIAPAATAVASEGNGSCLACHGAAGTSAKRIDFGVAPVDKASACNKCHWIGNHPVHRADSNCAQCHLGFPRRTDFFKSQVQTPYGLFTSQDSVNASPERLHDIHVNGSWPKSAAITGRGLNCVSCHAPAACDACHQDTGRHGGHSASAAATPTLRVTRGVAPTSTVLDTTYDAKVGCARTGCHAPAYADSPNAETFVDDRAASYTGSWQFGSLNFAVGGGFAATAETGAEALFTVQGAGELRVYATKASPGGIAAIVVNNAPAVYVDLYSATRLDSVRVFSVPVGPGSHTVRVIDTGMGVGAWTYVDAVSIRSDGPVSGAFGRPSCGSCHGVTSGDGHMTVHDVKPGLLNANGTGSYGYSVGSTATVKTTDCAMCHAYNPTNLVSEHINGIGWARKDRNGLPMTCDSCHKSTDPKVVAAIAGTGITYCEACHPVHAEIPIVHRTTYLASSPTDCALCHPGNLTGIHAGKTATLPVSGQVLSGCALCHEYRESDMGVRTQAAIEVTNDTKCSACHTAYHASAARKHDATAIAAGCGGTGCHAVADVGVIHNNSIPGNTARPSCVTCHKAPTYIATTINCSAAGCHSTTTGHRAAHQTAASQECVACHERANIQDQHAPAAIGAIRGGKTNDGCNICHGGGGWANVRTGSTRECVTCHRSTKVGAKNYSPKDPNHYTVTRHAATPTTLTPGGSCSGCHSMDMKTEHFKTTSAFNLAGYPDRCVACHELKVDAFTSAWNRSCQTQGCHAARHGDQNARHTSTRAECGGTGCHAIGNVVQIHSGPKSSCATCHKSATQPATTVDCLASGCHAGSSANHHESHNTTGVIDTGCQGCHFVYLDDEHTKLGYTCDTCHKSTNAAVVAAIAGDRRQCDACHPAVNGRDRHAGQKTMEFIPGNASGHRAYSTLPGMRSSFVVNGLTYTMSIPSASSFLRSGWTTSSLVTCNQCHSFGTNPAGPHGSAVTINIDPAFRSVKYSDAVLSKSSPGLPSGVICAKCHVLFNGSSWSNEAHKEHDDRGLTKGGRCVSCHSSIPHSWRLPRLLAYTTDPAPYRTVSGGTQAIKLRSYTPGNWSKSDCYAACDNHHDTMPSPVWPSTAPPAYGTLRGKVTNASGVAISSATVSVAGGGSTTTDASGNYSFPSVLTGTHSVTASRSGFTSQTKSVTILASQTATLDFALASAPTTGSITGRVTDSATGAGISAASVSVSGGPSASTDSGGYYTLSSVSAGTASVTYSRSGYTTQTLSVSVTAGGTTTQNAALVPVASSANLALNKTFTASRHESSVYAPGRAGDGSTSSYWWSKKDGRSDDTEWLRVDLGSRQRISRVEVAWFDSYWAREFRVHTSTDGSSWTEVFSTTSGGSGTRTITFSARDARHVRVECRKTSGSNTGYGIAELRVFQ